MATDKESATVDEEDQEEVASKLAGKDAKDQDKEPSERSDKAREDDEDDGPPPDHPRFNQVYGKMKAYERKLEERDRDFEMLRDHNRTLEERLATMETRKADKPDDPEPDPDVDPEAYRNWLKLQRVKDQETVDKKLAIERHKMQVDTQKELHEDYVDMVRMAEREMDKDAGLKKKIWESDNPAREAYKVGRKMAEEADKERGEADEREKNRGRMESEREGESGGQDEEEGEQIKLSKEEDRVARRMWPELSYAEARKKYFTQKKAMGRV